MSESEIISINEESISAEVTSLAELSTARAEAKEVIAKLATLKTECDKSLQHKIAAGKCGAYETILDTLAIYQNYRDVIKQGLKTLVSLMSKQPDLLDDRGVAVILSYLKKEVDLDLKKLALKWAKECCIMHELNRQKIFNSNIVEDLKEFLKDGNPEILKNVLNVCRALVLDDDVRVQFGKAYEHARVIATETLCALTALLTRFRQEEELISEIMQTICVLLVRMEFCQKVEDAGGLAVIKDVMLFFKADERIIRYSFKLLKAIAGNDQCKVHIIEQGFAPVLTSTLNINKENIQAAVAGVHCVATLSLRCPENSRALIEAGIADVIISIMRLHPEEELVQKTACWAIRNMVSRNKCQGRVFIDLDVEELLREDLKKFKDIEYDVKAALRDLSCNVHLKEEWTGKRGALATSSAKLR